jgi:hypothetical protein
MGVEAPGRQGGGPGGMDGGMRGDWFSGPLLSRHFVEQVLPRAFAGRLGEASADAGHRRMRQWLAAAHAMLGPASGLRALCDAGAAPLFACLGYRLSDVIAAGGDSSGLGGMLVGTLEGSHGVTLRIVIVPWQTPLDHTWRIALRTGIACDASAACDARDGAGGRGEQSGQRKQRGQGGQGGPLPRAGRTRARGRNPAHRLDAARHARWAFCFNGRRLRLVDIDRPYARRFLEFDLRETLNDSNRSRLLWAFARPAAFAVRAGTRPALASEIVAACDAHGVGVREALQGGVREALELLCAELARAARREPTAARSARTRLRSRSHDVARAPEIEGSETATTGLMVADARPTRPTAADVVSQGLTLLYRVLFLLFAEARALVPVWHPLYRDSYTIGTLHRQAEHQTPRGLWEALQAISRLAHAGCETDGLTITAFNSQLFSPDGAPLIDRARIDSAIVARILQSLMTTPGAKGRGRERITYADLGVEQLGAVYERVLDYAPQLEATTASHLAAPSHRRCPAPSQEGAPAARDIDHDAAPRPRHPRTSEDGLERAAKSPGALTSVAEGPIATRPHVDRASTDMRRVVALRSSGRGRRTSVRRKESGTFYTPRSLADYLVRETLAPLTATATADRILSLRVLDPAMGSGAFLVSACRFLTQAYEQALAREDRPLPATDAARAEIRRTIARRCLFGVDLNPMAVQLARLSLWLTTLTTDAPLTFLDHHLRTGDSLIGASLDDLARRRPAWPMRARAGMARRAGRMDAASLPLFTGDDTSHLMRSILPARAQLTLEDDRPETVHEKERLLASLARDSALSSWLTLADLWCASWFWPAATDTGSAPAPPPTAWAALCDQVLRGSSMLPAHVAQGWLDRARDVAARQRFFHWTLEFPEVFFDTSGEPRADGGFDAIVGNPPWDMVRDDVRSDGGDEGGHAADDRGADRGDDRGVDRGVDRGADRNCKRRESDSRAAVSRFVRESGIYDTIGDAHANSYQLFVDRSLSLLRRDGGRLGLVVPWGLAADHGSARLRRRLLERCDVDTMISFDNRDGLFPIHRSLRFLLFTSTAGRVTARVACRFGERDPAILDRLTRDTSTLTIAPALLRRVSGEGLAFPDVRSPECLSLLERMHATWPALTSAEGWNVTFGRELHASDDRRRFEEVTEPPWSTNEWPVIEGKHLHPFQVRVDEARFAVASAHREAVHARVPGLTRHRLAYRDVSCATNRMTLIAAIVPPHVVTTHTLFCLRSPLELEAQHALCGLMNSFVANYFVRLRISTHVTLASLDHLPVPTPGAWTGDLADLAANLSRTTTPAPAAPHQPHQQYLPHQQYQAVTATAVVAARLQALAARAYGITPDEFRHVLSTFPLVGKEERTAALETFVRLA